MVDILKRVKDGLMITGSQFDNVLSDYIEEVKFYLKSAGVDPDTIESDECVGVIRRGVSDLWSNDGGSVKFSPYFYDRITQLAMEGVAKDVQTKGN